MATKTAAQRHDVVKCQCGRGGWTTLWVMPNGMIMDEPLRQHYPTRAQAKAAADVGNREDR